MESGILPELLQSLSKEEQAALRKYLHSPYFNARKDVQALFDYLTHGHEKPAGGGLSRESAFAAVFRAGDFDARQMNYTVSYLIRLTEDFIALQGREADELGQRIELVRALRQRRLDRLSDRTRRSAEKKLAAQQRRDAGFFRQQYHLAGEMLQTQLQEGRGREIAFDLLTESHEKSFISEKLKVGCMLQSRRTIARKDYETGLLPLLLDFLQGHPYLEEPAIAAYYHGYRMQTDGGDKEHFERLKSLMIRHAALFPDDERHDLFLLAVNFCIRRINSGEPEFSRDLFDLYREGLEQGVFLENGVISRWTYNNIVNAALKLGEIDWALAFLEKFRPRLEAAHRDAGFHFNLARCLYEKGEYTEALGSLTRIEYDDILQNLSARTLQMKIYFSLAAWHPLDSLLDSMGAYLRRKKVLGYHRENIVNAVRLMRQLLALPPGDKPARQKLRQEIESCPALSEKGWFLAQLENLDARRQTPDFKKSGV